MKRKFLNDERGQMTIEMIMLLTVMVAVMMSFSKLAKDGKWMQDLVSGPWKPMQGMIEDGVWKNTKESKAYNPSIKKRHGTYQGNEVN